MGKVLEIGIPRNKNNKIENVNNVEAVKGKGLTDDRKFKDNNDTATPWFGSYTALQGDTYASGKLTINEGDYNNQEVSIGGVDFTFVAPTVGTLNNSSTQIFVTSGSTTGSSINNLRSAINNTVSSSLHGLAISASIGTNPGSILILSGKILLY